MPEPHPPFLEAVARDGALPVAPSMSIVAEGVHAPVDQAPVDRRVVAISGIAILVAILAGFAAHLLTGLIGLITNLSFYGRVAAEPVSPADNTLGLWVVLVPIGGALIVGVMARYGSAAIRGHGIPEVMERVLHGESRIAPRLMFLKPLSAAVAIGTGGPFGAEGPIIATGGALGSLMGQVVRITADERKTLLAAGAAAGMAATFGSPVAAVLLAVELLLFEYRPRSVIPVALASAAATGVRLALVGSAPAFAMAVPAAPGAAALAIYAGVGALIGALAAGITRAVYAVEDAFEHLPVHWMWWPALGAVVVGVIGYLEPRTLGVGYTNIDAVLTGSITGTALLALVVLKFASWIVYLGSGTSGGTLAPLFTIGGGTGAMVGATLAAAAPSLGVDPHVAALVGMAAIFAGASHALMASVVFAFETTRQPMGLLPLLAGCSAAYLASLLLSRTSIMTEKLARRGANAGTEYVSDFLGQVRVAEVATREVLTLSTDDTVEGIRRRLRATTHQGFPVLDAAGEIRGVLTRRDLLDPLIPAGTLAGSLVRRPPIVAFEHNTLREAADHMVGAGVGRLLVVSPEDPSRLLGILTRSDLLDAHARRIRAAGHKRVVFRPLARKRPPRPPA